MKILLLGLNKLKLMPYALFYLDQIDRIKHEVHLIYWNRDLKDEDLTSYNKVHLHEFKRFLADNSAKKTKLVRFWEYRKFTNEILRNLEFDLIITLHTMPGLLVCDKLLLNYNHKYIFDYRDHTFERNIFFGNLVKFYSDHSLLTFVSSVGFKKFLPTSHKVEIITSHNILEDSLNHRNDHINGFISSDKIRICFWGCIRNMSHNISIIKQLANDLRFELHFYGKGDTEIKDFCSKEKIDNVFCHGEYLPTDRYSFVKECDIIHNSFDDENMMLAMSNKYYDGIIFKIPQLCMKGSYMANRCIQKGTGIALDPNDVKYGDKIYNYMKKLDKKIFNERCDEDLEEILDEYEEGKQKIKNIIGE